MTSRNELDRLLERGADDVADAALLVGIGLIEKACADARAALEFRWRSYPRGELRGLRRGVKAGLRLCTLAMLVVEVDRERFDEERRLHEDLAAAARTAKGRPARLDADGKCGRTSRGPQP